MADIDGFMFFRSYYDAIRALPEPADRCALYDALGDYAFAGVVPELEGVLAPAMWNLMLPNLNQSIAKARAARRKRLYRDRIRTEGGTDSALSADEGRDETGAEEKEKEKEKLEEKAEEKAGRERETVPAPFSPPSVETVRAYCQSKGLTVDPVRFVRYYESCGWRVGRNPMVSWEAAVEGWARNGFRQSEPADQGYTLGQSELTAIGKLRALRDSLAGEDEAAAGAAPEPPP